MESLKIEYYEVLVAEKLPNLELIFDQMEEDLESIKVGLQTLLLKHDDISKSESICNTALSNNDDSKSSFIKLLISPNFGGLWEAGVKSFKYRLKRTIGNFNLTIEEFLTVVNQVEGFCNGPRNFEPWSSDVDDTCELAPPSPNYHTNGRTFQLSTDLACIAALHGGSLVVLGSSSGQSQPRPDTYTTRLPQPTRSMNRNQVNWVDIENYVEFLSKEIPDIKIDDNCLLELERRLNVYLNSNKLEQLENQYAKKLPYKKKLKGVMSRDLGDHQGRNYHRINDTEPPRSTKKPVVASLSINFLSHAILNNNRWRENLLKRSQMTKRRFFGKGEKRCTFLGLPFLVIAGQVSQSVHFIQSIIVERSFAG
ncbi:uncharacterized protein TNCV_1616671 [Trichonephila clavipes]|nr:uncharacterized protein TNCV_1616671 [Trichonephila clavipes]